jgi:4-hydroxy-tetrahydrodipicolinate reductase
MKVAIHGATGRMGRAVVRLLHETQDAKIVGAIAHVGDPDQGKDIGALAGIDNVGVAVGPDVASGLLGADVVIDFSLAPAVAPLAAIAAKQGVALVTGTTNLDETAKAALENASQKIPVLWARNMSLGIQVLSELVELALKRLGPDFDAEVMEIHHRYKVDAPSGTALRLLDSIRAVRPDTLPRFGREGETGAREREEVAVIGLRGGDVVGDHTVFLLGSGERIELTHRASNRDLFANGAIRAARFLVGKKPGQYTISDVLG